MKHEKSTKRMHELTKVTFTRLLSRPTIALQINIADSHSSKPTGFFDLAIANIKVEIGNEATPFTLAPSDGGPVETIHAKREGLVFEDVQFDGSEPRVISPLLISGVVYENRLPLSIEQVTKDELNKIVFYNGE